MWCGMNSCALDKLSSTNVRPPFTVAELVWRESRQTRSYTSSSYLNHLRINSERRSMFAQYFELTNTWSYFSIQPSPRKANLCYGISTVNCFESRRRSSLIARMISPLVSQIMILETIWTSLYNSFREIGRREYYWRVSSKNRKTWLVRPLKMRQKSERCVRTPRSQRKLLLAFTNKRVSRSKPLSRRPPSGWDHRRGRAIWSLQNRRATCKSIRMASSRFTTKRLDKARANRWGT